MSTDLRKAPRSLEVREKIRKALLGKKHPLERIEANRRGHIGLKQSEETRRKKSKAMVGSKNPNWQGGKTSINQHIRSSLEYKLWREAVFERDSFRCVWCGVGGDMIADHIKPFSLYPELRFAIDNGRTLCESCHSKTDTYCGRVQNYE